MAGFASRAILSLVSLFLVGLSLLFMFFIALSGLTTIAPFGSTHWLRARTAGITGAKPVTQWNYLYTCGEGNTNCGHARAAPVLGSAWSPNASGVPQGLSGRSYHNTTSTHIFLLLRFAWAFFLISWFFITMAFVSGFLAFCGHLGAKLSAASTLFALMWHTLAMTLFTVGYTKSRNRFRAAGREAELGQQAFGFGWGTWALLLASTLLFCLASRHDKPRHHTQQVVTHEPAVGAPRRGVFGRPVRNRAY